MLTAPPGVANPERALGSGLAAPLPLSSSRFILLGAGRDGGKAPPFIFSGCAGHFHGNRYLTLQQPHAVSTFILFMIQVGELRCRKQGPCKVHTCGRWWSWAGQSGLRHVSDICREDKTVLEPLGGSQGLQVSRQRKQVGTHIGGACSGSHSRGPLRVK